jgi:NAD(P)-dependent dehydrogenase (short-subunit alcohol dehydrogenase family)
MANDIDLKGRTAVVTGGAGFREGDHRALLNRAPRSPSGTPLARKTVRRSARTSGGRPRCIRPCAVAKARDATTKALGRIDILQYGIAGVNAKTWETDVEEWRRVRINLDGPFICRAPGAADDRSERWPDVNIASIAGKKPQRRALPASGRA